MITARILKISSPCFLSPLTYICNRVLTTGTFPDRLKFSEIKPMYKKCDKTLITGQFHYYLFSQKIFEKVIYIYIYIVTILPFNFKQHINKRTVWLQV